MRPHATRVRVPGYVIGLALMAVSAALTVGGFYLFLVWLLSRLPYIPTLP